MLLACSVNTPIHNSTCVRASSVDGAWTSSLKICLLRFSSAPEKLKLSSVWGPCAWRHSVCVSAQTPAPAHYAPAARRASPCRGTCLAARWCSSPASWCHCVAPRCPWATASPAACPLWSAKHVTWSNCVKRRGGGVSSLGFKSPGSRGFRGLEFPLPTVAAYQFSLSSGNHQESRGYSYSKWLSPSWPQRPGLCIFFVVNWWQTGTCHPIVEQHSSWSATANKRAVLTPCVKMAESPDSNMSSNSSFVVLRPAAKWRHQGVNKGRNVTS